MNVGLSGRVVVVTGAASGIGRAAAEQFHAEGARVVLVGRDRRVEEAATDLPGASAVTVDLTSSDAAEIVAEHTAALGGCDVLVNNAGVAPVRDRALAATPSDWRQTFEINLFAVVALCQSLAPQLRRSGGVVVNVASTSGRHPEPMLADYAASKAALLSFTGALATELGPDGVRVLAVSPGPTRTPLWDAPGGFVDGLADRYGLDREAAVRHHITEVRKVALGRPATAEQVARSIVFAASAAADHITGTSIDVHGGMVTHLM